VAVLKHFRESSVGPTVPLMVDGTAPIGMGAETITGVAATGVAATGAT